MADAKINVLPSVDPLAVGVDNETVTTGAGEVYRQRVAVPDGADVAQGTTTDTSSSSTVIGLLKAIKAAITGTLSVSGPVTDTQLRATPVPVSGTVTATTGGLTDTQLRATAVPIADGGGSLTVDGTVAVSGTVAVTDNSGTLTVDAPVATPVFVRLSDGAAAITALPVTDNAGSLTVDNNGTFVVQATLAAETTKVIGTVNQGTSPWVTNDPGLPDTLGQKSMANSTGVVIASDQASIPVAATLTAETTKVIGTVNQGTSPWVTNDPGLPDTLGQKTMANSTGVVLASDQASIPVTATLAAETTKVIGTVNQGTSPWVTNDPGLPDTLGQKTMANSTGVVLASDQASVPVAATLTAETTKVLGSVRALDGSGNFLSASGPGFLRVTDEPSQSFYDPFDGDAIDLTSRWDSSYGLGGLPASQLSGQMTLNAGSTSGGWASLSAKAALTPTVPAWLGCSFALNLTDGAALVSGGYRFWGVGTIPTTPTVASPLTDAVGFEVVGGKLIAVVYAAGVRTAIQDLSAATGNSLAPTDALNHRYIVQVRTDKTYWYIDTLTTPVATSNFQSPAQQTLPIRYLAVSGGAATTIQSPGVAAWDTGKNAQQIADGTYPWRKATVSASGALKVDASATVQPVRITTLTGVQDELLLELKKHTMQLGLLLSQFNVNEFDLEGIVN